MSLGGGYMSLEVGDVVKTKWSEATFEVVEVLSDDEVLCRSKANVVTKMYFREIMKVMGE